ncbi:MAG: hypothetical protein CLLPBCKN_002030 [Chroococcidiopsis cubana SAG 39.79]|jgi:hypothetical protein|nr:hypothetical protein [Chroococcidiopsis cubana SAG 39.79]
MLQLQVLEKLRGTLTYMSKPKKIPDPDKVKRTVEQLRDSNRQLELVTLALDELIARVDNDLRHQRRTRLQGRNYKF